MTRIYDDEKQAKIFLLWARVEDAVVELDDYLKTGQAEESAADCRRVCTERPSASSWTRNRARASSMVTWPPWSSGLGVLSAGVRAEVH